MKRALVYLFVCLWVWAPLAQLRAIPLHVFLGGGTASSPSGYIPFTAGFDGTNDYLRLSATGASGLADGTVFTFSAVVDLTADGAEEPIFAIATSGANTRLSITRSAAGKLNVFTRNTAGAAIGEATGNTDVVASSGWQHIYVCWNTASGQESQCKIYVGGVSQTLTWATAWATGTLDFIGTSHRYTIGGNSDTTPATYFNGSMTEVWFNDTYLDNPSAFFTGGAPVDLGSTGSVPTGSQPAFYFSRTGSGDSWATNAGTAGSPTVNGGGLTSPSYP